MNKVIKADLYRYGGLTGWKGLLRGFFSHPNFRYIYYFRKCTEFDKHSIRGIFFRLLKKRCSFRYGYEIRSLAQIGEGFYLSDHRGYVVIGEAKIGKNCNVAHAVTIGRAYKNGKIGFPVIGDHVWIGTGSVLVGAINIGRNVLIAPNSYVNFNVPDNSIVIGNPGKIIEKENPTKYYINYVPEDEEYKDSSQ